MTADAHVEEHFAGTNKLFISIWVWLVVLTLVEIFLAYKPMSIFLMLVVLLGLSIIKAALIVAYFMHLKFERLSLILTLIPALVVCILLLRYKFQEQPPVAPAPLEEP
jgi:cytochrome c oxidase subunit 4